MQAWTWVNVSVFLVPHWWYPRHHGFWPLYPRERGIVVPQSSALAESWPAKKGWPVTRPPANRVGPRWGIGLLGTRLVRALGGSTSVRGRETQSLRWKMFHCFCVCIVAATPSLFWYHRSMENVQCSNDEGLRWEQQPWSGINTPVTNKEQSLTEELSVQSELVTSVCTRYLVWSHWNAPERTGSD